MIALGRYTVFVLVVFYVSVSSSYGAKLPKDWIRCNLKNPGANECIRKSVEEVITKLKYGAPELSLSPLDPLFIPSMTIGAGAGPVNVVQHFEDIKLHGLSRSMVLSGSVDLENNRLLAESITPMMRLEAKYKMNGRILVLPIQGDGPCNITLVNTAINHTLQGERIHKKGREFLRITNYTVTLYPERLIFKFDNLFNGDSRLGDEINKVLNENQDAVFNDIRNGYEQSFGYIFQDLANRVFGKVGITDIFLD